MLMEVNKMITHVLIPYSIKTNISNSFFMNDDVDENFTHWIFEALEKNNYYIFEKNLTQKQLELCQFLNKDKQTVKIELNSISKDHSAEITIRFFTNDDRQFFEYEDLLDNKAFVELIENEIIPEYVEYVNSALNITFPTHEGSFGDYIEFRNGQFYAVLYNDFTDTYKITKTKLQLENVITDRPE